MIDIVDLTKSFDSHRVLDGLSLTVKTGETLVIIGRSGCGKSVLLKHIIGLMKPQEGSIIIDGIDVTKLSGRALDVLRKRFGMLFQSAALFDSLTVWENVGFALREHTSTPEAAVRERVRECLGLVGLEGVEELMPSELSGGMRKRVGLARAIAMNPDIILYDEPTTGVDPIMGDVINELIIGLRDRMRVTSIVVTHDMASAYLIADRIGMIYKGKLVEAGAPKELLKTTHPVVRQFIDGKTEGPLTAEEVTAPARGRARR